MLKLAKRVGISQETMVLIIDSLLSSVILLPVLMVSLAAYSVESAATGLALVATTLLWACVATASLMSRLYRPHKTALLRCLVTKGLLLRIFQSLVVALIAVLGFGLWLLTLQSSLGVKLLGLLSGGFVLITITALTLAIPALARTALLANEFSAIRIWRIAKWAWRKSPLEATAKILQDVLVASITWIPVAAVLGAISLSSSSTPNWELGFYKLPLLAVITASIIIASHCGAICYQHAASKH